MIGWMIAGIFVLLIAVVLIRTFRMKPPEKHAGGGGQPPRI